MEPAEVWGTPEAALPPELRPRRFLPKNMPPKRARSFPWNADGPVLREVDTAHLGRLSAPMDLDVIRGSTFYTATATNHNAVRSLIQRVLFFPLYFRFWRHEMSVVAWCAASALYVAQVCIVAQRLFGWHAPPSFSLRTATPAATWPTDVHSWIPSMWSETLQSTHPMTTNAMLLWCAQVDVVHVLILVAVFAHTYARANASRFPVHNHYDDSSSDSECGSEGSDVDLHSPRQPRSNHTFDSTPEVERGSPSGLRMARARRADSETADDDIRVVETSLDHHRAPVLGSLHSTNPGGDPSGTLVGEQVRAGALPASPDLAPLERKKPRGSDEATCQRHGRHGCSCAQGSATAPSSPAVCAPPSRSDAVLPPQTPPLSRQRSASAPQISLKPRPLRDGDISVKAKVWGNDNRTKKLVLSLSQLNAAIGVKVAETRAVAAGPRTRVVACLACTVALSPVFVRMAAAPGLMQSWLSMNFVAAAALSLRSLSTSSAITSLLNVSAVLSTNLDHVVCMCSLALLSFHLLQLFAKAESALQRRFYAAKFFSAITSARRSRKYSLPHFRLHNVANIKMWLSLRALVRRRGAKRSVDMVVSVAFVLALMLVTSIMLIQVSESNLSPVYWTLVLWAMAVSFFLMQFLTIGTRINTRYKRSGGVLLTEQMNVHLRMFRFPHKKAELSVANAVLKVAQSLIKDLDSPDTISGLSMSPLLYQITRVVVLSALSSVVSEMLGFKLKIWKFKM